MNQLRTNLHNRKQVRHRVKIIYSEIVVTPCPDLTERFHDFCSESFLDLAVLSEFPEGKRQLRGWFRYIASLKAWTR